MTRSIPWALAFVLTIWAVAPSSPAAAEAVFCDDPGPFVIEIENLEVAGRVSGNVCFATFFECEAPISQEPTLGLADPNCNPLLETCSVTRTVPFEFPGTENNVEDDGPTPRLYYFHSSEPPDCEVTPTNNCGAITLCGFPGTPLILSDFAQTLVTIGGVTCDSLNTLSEELSISAFACISNDSCRRRTDVPNLGFHPTEVAEAIGCPVPPEPPPEACNGDASCQYLPGRRGERRRRRPGGCPGRPGGHPTLQGRGNGDDRAPRGRVGYRAGPRLVP